MPATNGVTYIRNEISTLLPIWFLVRDCIEGEPAVKGEYGVRRTHFQTSGMIGLNSQARKYLPMPNPADRSDENLERYRQYVERAQWYNFTSRTFDGLVGQIFLRPPVIEKPKQLDVLNQNCDGNGLNLLQVSKRAVQSTLAYGRAGLLTDYPKVDGAVTPADIQTRNIQPTVRFYYPWQIRNWATTQIGAQQVLTLLVLEEYVLEEDDFAMIQQTNYRVLRLDPKTGDYTVQVWKQKPDASGKLSGDYSEQSAPAIVTDANGQPFKEIPFKFVGAEANDPVPDKPPLYDLASLNIGHYRNSADYEESCHIAGQPTPVITGLTEEWAKEILKGTVTLGSRAAVMLPVGADGKLLQASPNQLPFEAMRLKEDQAIGLGAKLVQKQKTIRTATEVMVDTTSESSTLHNVATNVSDAVEDNLRWAARFVGAKEDAIKYRLNTEFELTRMNANDRLAVVKLWQSGAICFPEMRAVLKVDGTASMDDNAAQELISKELAAAATLGGAPIADPLQSKSAQAPTNAIDQQPRVPTKA